MHLCFRGEQIRTYVGVGGILCNLRLRNEVYILSGCKAVIKLLKSSIITCNFRLTLSGPVGYLYHGTGMSLKEIGFHRSPIFFVWDVR